MMQRTWISGMTGLKRACFRDIKETESARLRDHQGMGTKKYRTGLKVTGNMVVLSTVTE